MKSGIINSKLFISAGLRIDPDIYLSEGSVVRNDLQHLPYELSTVGENAVDVFYGNIFSRIFVHKPEHGMPYLAASDTVLANLNTGRYLSKSQAANLSYLILKKDWILVTCSGTLGNVTYTNKNFENHIATHDLIRIIPNSKRVNKGTLYAFLSSKYGYYQITQSQFGGVVKHINTEQTKSIIVPVFPEDFQRAIDDHIQESARMREQATDALNKAISKVNDYCSWPFEKTFGHKTSSMKISNIRDSYNLRLDAPVFVNDGVRWLSSIKRPTKRLGDCKIKTWYPGIFKRVYVRNGLPYVKGSALFLTNPFKSCDQLSKTKTPQLDELWLKERMLLISCAGACGDVRLITKEYEDKNAIGSPDIIRLTSSDSLFTTEYIFAYLQIPAVYDFMQSMKYGSVIERFDKYSVENIPIVEPSQELSQEVTDIIRQYMNYTYRAFQLEETAITMVEEEIEKWNN